LSFLHIQDRSPTISADVNSWLGFATLALYYHSADNNGQPDEFEMATDIGIVVRSVQLSGV
jgi:hypothetical protein